MAGTEHPMLLEVHSPPPKALRDHQPRLGSGVTFELCGCGVPVAVGMQDDHLRAIPHRSPPLGQQSPEG
jgi:hypothetical protein